MNENFFSLPIEKKEAIINAGFLVFSQSSYKKSPMSEIADAAGISKSLLFHYVDEMECDFIRLVDFWKSVYLRKE